MGLERVRIVLVRPRSSGNVGAAARAMKNMGLGRLVLVAPWRFERAPAAAMAVHAADVLADLRVVATVTEAVAGCGLVVGTSARETAVGHGAVSPRLLAPEVVAASAANDIALVFGPENHGLSNDELVHCQRLVHIPASGAYGSLNLAQAVLVCAYELFLAAAETVATGPAAAPARGLAASERLELMYGKLEAALRRIGFLRADTAEHMMRTVRRMLGRAGLDEREVRVVLGLARQLAWYGTRGAARAQGDGAGRRPRVATWAS
jgi:TrmH family RNA methyltransferase